MTTQKRNGIERKRGGEWDLSHLFPSVEEAEESLKRSARKVEIFNTRYKGRLGTLEPHQFRRAVEEYEKILESLGRVHTYAFLLFATDSSKGGILNRFEQEITKIETQLLWFELEFIRLPEKRRSKFIEESGKYKYLLLQWVEEAPYRLGEKEEQILTKKELTSFSAFTRLFDEEMGRFRVDWDGKEIGEEELLSHLYSPDRETRKRAQILMTLELEKRLPLLTYLYNRVVEDWKLTNCDIRGFESPEAPRHLSNRVSQKSVDKLVEVVNKNTDIVEEYYNLKRELLGYSHLLDYDRYAPLESREERVPFEEAKEVVLNTFQNFSPTFHQIAQRAFDDNWIDVYPRSGKRGGAFSCSTTPGVHPYVLLNYTHTRRDIFTLAHELGHAIHQYLSQQAGYLNQNTPLTTAETASIFAEMLLFQQMKKELSREELIPLYASKLEDIFATLFRQIVFTNFERRVFSHIGELTADQLNQIWEEENRKMFGNSVILTSNYRSWWSYIPHFYHTPFYCYAYSYAELLVLTLYQLYREGYPRFEELYLSLLKEGGSRPPQLQFESFGLNLEDPNFWERGIKFLREMVEEFRELVRKEKGK
jgi:oligoendopeptidase F